jgi:hypothetical protein
MQDNTPIHKAHKVQEIFSEDRDRHNGLAVIFAGLEPYRKPLEDTKSGYQQNIS